jgi:dienelactone hydrolase
MMLKLHLNRFVLILITLALVGCSFPATSPSPDAGTTETPVEEPSPTPSLTPVPATRTPLPTATITPTPTPIPSFEILTELFEYDQEHPVDLVVEAEETRDGVIVQTVKYYGAEHSAYHRPLRVTAYLVLPAWQGSFPALLYLHAGGMDKEQYLDEAILLARNGVVCLLIDGPLSSIRGSRLDPFDLSKVRDAYIRTVIDLRRGVDVLESLPQVDPSRMAYVGHSYGATWGGVLAGLETRLRAYVLMAGYPQISENDTPQVPELDAIRYLGFAAPAAYLFQFAEDDAFIDREEAQLYFDTANEPKTMLWYDTDHFTLQHESQADRLHWLGVQLGFYVYLP